MTTPIFTGFNHFCVVTADLDRAAAAWTERYGVGPWTTFTMDEGAAEAFVDGAPVQLRSREALAPLGAHARIQLLQPLSDVGPYAESLARHGGADHLHHLCLDVGDYDRAREDLDGLGVPTVMEGRATPGSPMAGFEAVYFDTQADLGFIAEIVRRPQTA